MADRDAAWERFGQKVASNSPLGDELWLSVPEGREHGVIGSHWVRLMMRAAIVYMRQGIAPDSTTIFSDIVTVDHEIPRQGIVYAVADSLAGLALAEVFYLADRRLVSGLRNYPDDGQAVFDQNPGLWREERGRRGYWTVQVGDGSGRTLLGLMVGNVYVEGMIHSQVVELAVLDPAVRTQQPAFDYSI